MYSHVLILESDLNVFFVFQFLLHYCEQKAVGSDIEHALGVVSQTSLGLSVVYAKAERPA